MRYLFLILLISLGCDNGFVKTKSTDLSIDNNIAWHWEDDFSEAEQAKLITYLTEVTEATFKILGEYPFKVHYFLHRSDRDNEPIPWAHTERSEIQGVHFYVSANFNLKEFRADWTAPHEISHLSIPFLGKSNAWFSEGYATYMQLQIMHAMGIYTASSMKKRYAMKDRLVADDFSEQKPFLENVMEQKATRNYPAMYWGSVRYFKKINEQLLINEQITLCQHIKNYQSVSRLKDESIDDLLQSLDDRLTSPIFRNLYEKCSEESFFDAFN